MNRTILSPCDYSGAWSRHMRLTPELGPPAWQYQPHEHGHP